MRGIETHCLGFSEFLLHVDYNNIIRGMDEKAPNEEDVSDFLGGANAIFLDVLEGKVQGRAL